MGSLFSGKKTTKTDEQFDSGPSKFQQPFLQTAFDGAQQTFKSQQGTPFYQGDLYASLSPDARASLDRLKGFAFGTGLGGAGTLSSIGTTMAGSAGKAGSTVDDYLRIAAEDPTQSNIAAARAYAADPSIDAMVDASSRDVVRNLNEGTLPALNRQASAGGNINSSRAGIAEGLARRGAEDRVADISAGLRSDAFNRGLSLASQDRATRLQAMGSAADRYMGLAGTGMAALRTGADMGYDAFGQIAAADEADQGDRQGRADADYARWQGQDTRATDLLNRYYGIVGSNSWGQSGTRSGTTVETTTPSVMGTIAGLASTAAAFTPMGAAGGALKTAGGLSKIGSAASGAGALAKLFGR